MNGVEAGESAIHPGKPYPPAPGLGVLAVSGVLASPMNISDTGVHKSLAYCCVLGVLEFLASKTNIRCRGAHLSVAYCCVLVCCCFCLKYFLRGFLASQINIRCIYLSSNAVR